MYIQRFVEALSRVSTRRKSRDLRPRLCMCVYMCVCVYVRAKKCDRAERAETPTKGDAPFSASVSHLETPAEYTPPYHVSRHL